jgi:peptidoglycan/LPS O-acetylase OafA/YrhL
LLLGEISFSFYMFHKALEAPVHTRLAAMGFTNCGPRTFMVVLFLITVLTSLVCYYGYERPMQQRVKRWLIGERRSQPGAGREPDPERGASARTVRYREKAVPPEEPPGRAAQAA